MDTTLSLTTGQFRGYNTLIHIHTSSALSSLSISLPHSQLVSTSFLNAYMRIFTLTFLAKAMMNIGLLCYRNFPHVCLYVRFLSWYLGKDCSVVRCRIYFIWKESFHSYYISDLGFIFYFWGPNAY